jgi:formylmethanofuran dehydrogenase subunit C
MIRAQSMPESIDSYDTFASKVSIKRGGNGGLGDMFSYDANDVENEREVVAVNDSAIKEAITEFRYFLNNRHDATDLHYGYELESLLTPVEISAFIPASEKFSLRENYSLNFGIFVSKLIEKSYRQGENNDFLLNLEGMPKFRYLLNRLNGDKSNPIRITALGNVGTSFANHMKNVKISIVGSVAESSFYSTNNLSVNIEGNVGYGCMRGSGNGIININGNVGNSFGSNSKGILAKIKGNVGPNLGCYSYDLSLLINGNVGDHFGVHSHDLMVVINGDVKDHFGIHSEYLQAVIEGNGGLDFARDSNYLRSFVTGDIAKIKKGFFRGNEIYRGEKVKDQPQYDLIKLEIDRRMRSI